MNSVSVINPQKKIKIKILGTGAGSGCPQWNCNCRNCKSSRKGIIPQRMRSSIAVNNPSKHTGWTLINASPDIRNQFNEFLVCGTCADLPGPLRNNRVKNIVLCDAQLDHTLGLLNIREGDPLNIYCTKAVEEQITEEFPIIKILESYCGTTINEIVPNKIFSPMEGVLIIPIDIESKSPPYSKHRNESICGSNIGLVIINQATGQKMYYAPGLGAITQTIEEIFSKVDYILIDGTCWTNDELINIGISHQSALDMGHLSQSSGDSPGLIEILKKYPKLKKALIHINNTNPILDPNSAEFAILKNNNISVSYDGMEIYL